MGANMTAEIRKKGLEVSTKTLVIAPSPALAEKAAHKMLSRGCPVRAALYSEDVGVGTSGPAKRSVKAQKGRNAKTKIRAKNCAVLATVDRSASKLFLTGVAPMNGYGN